MRRPATPKIKHIAIFSDDPSRLAKFYGEVFGLRTTGESQGDVWVTDGYVDVALISRKRANAPRGIHHWGFTLSEDAKPVIYSMLNARGLPIKDPRAEDPTIDRPYVEHAGYDIDGNRYDLTTSKRDMDVEKARTRERLSRSRPRNSQTFNAEAAEDARRTRSRFALCVLRASSASSALNGSSQ